jgi:hypothetical protein
MAGVIEMRNVSGERQQGRELHSLCSCSKGRLLIACGTRLRYVHPLIGDAATKHTPEFASIPNTPPKNKLHQTPTASSTKPGGGGGFEGLYETFITDKHVKVVYLSRK